MKSALPPHIDRCAPSRPCPQAAGCARAQAYADDWHREIDGSVCLPATGCGLFIDQRAVVLLQRTAQANEPQRAAHRPARGAAPQRSATVVALPATPATWLTPIGVAA